MNIRCPHCQTMFRVNPDRIPAGGVRAKCARCGDTFLVTRPPQTGGQSGPAAPASDPRRTAASPPRGPAPANAPSPPPSPSAEPGPQPPRHTPAAEQAEDAARPTEPVADPSRSAPPAGVPVFGARDPKQKAERLARALVSDIVAYHPERLARSYASGSLRTEFRDEIMKSWEEYVAQVGIELAKSTPYFRDALNNILAKGQKVF